jgi:hypothetical protein
MNRNRLHGAGIGAGMLLSVLTTLPTAAQVVPPTVPRNLEVPAGHEPFLMGRAAGTQNYVCLPSGAAFAWTFFGPQAILFSDVHAQVTTHFLSSNPFENGTARATWTDSSDTSSVWAVAEANSSDPAFVASGTIPWLLLRVTGAVEGPTGGSRMTSTAFIHRLNTAGGVAPTTGCAVAADVGKRALVPYLADYYFYREIGGTRGRRD